MMKTSNDSFIFLKLSNTVFGIDAFCVENSTGINSSYTAAEMSPIAFSVTVNTLKEHDN